MLIVTNGANAVESIERTGITADLLAWDDVLHDGPVPAGLSLDELTTVRARFIADRGWGPFTDVLGHLRRRNDRLRLAIADDELVLWFEHDLYDQLQLLQVLDWVASAEPRPARLTLICHERFVSQVSDDQLRADFAAREPVQPDQLDVAKDAWGAVRSPTPESWVQLLQRNLDALPFVRPALERLLEELPGRDGLARSERQILAVVAEGAADERDAFAAAQRFESTVYLGDASFFGYVARLTGGPVPMLQRDENGLRLTTVGQAVLDRREDFVRVNGVHRWLGGVRLSRDNLWRWDGERRALRHRKSEPSPP